MRFNKISLLPTLFTIWIVSSNGLLINEPNPRLGFPSRSQSTANALYSAIELSLATFPHGQIKKEVNDMKKNILRHSQQQYTNMNPKAVLGYQLLLNRKRSAEKPS
ncbi:unnamed protein product [Caenorhabditis brenneri]